jgi:glycosyltransferase involved in cell wall biosynthesis
MVSIVVVGQTPPPFGGQAVMIDKMLRGRYANAQLHHVRMAFAKDMDDLGRFRAGKVLHALGVIARIVWARVRYRAAVLYFPPSGPDLRPILRDLAILLPTRWMFRKTVFHFHAAGTREIYPRLPRFVRSLYWFAYRRPDVAIRTSELNPDDGAFLEAGTSLVIPNGLEDDYALIGCPPKPINQTCNVLFVGLVNESKGTLVLLDAMRILKERDVPARLTVVGQFVSEEFRNLAMTRVHSYDLGDLVTFTGVLSGRAKYEQYLRADIFCFPTFFESESFGLVVVEAMQFKVPVVVSRWRGVQSVVRDGASGYLVPPHDPVSVADRLEQLVADPALRTRMGEFGREVFLREYTVEQFHRRIDECLAGI